MISELVHKWIVYGDYDLIVVENELNVPEERQIAQIIAFHCQQAVEKYLKAYIIHKENRILKTHNLEYLIEICSVNDEDFRQIDVGELTNFAVDIRYPEIDYIPSISEVKYYYAMVKKIKAFIMEKLTN